MATLSTAANPSLRPRLPSLTPRRLSPPAPPLRRPRKLALPVPSTSLLIPGPQHSSIRRSLSLVSPTTAQLRRLLSHLRRFRPRLVLPCAATLIASTTVTLSASAVTAIAKRSSTSTSYSSENLLHLQLWLCRQLPHPVISWTVAWLVMSSPTAPDSTA